MLALTVVLFKWIFNYMAVVDTHNGGLLLTRGVVLRAVGRFLRRMADITIVTNRHLAAIVSNDGGRPFVLPDRLPNISYPPLQLSLYRKQIVCVNSFARDEPFEAVFAAAHLLPDFDFKMTGDYKRKRITEGYHIPPNVTLTGYVEREEYDSLLRTADVIVVLTTNENCLLCGCYEAVSAEKPLVTTNTAALMEHFSQGVEYCDNSPKGIAQAISSALTNEEDLTRDIRKLKTRLIMEWWELAEQLKQQCCELIGTTEAW
jgi:glycosyltransferase involved in cell wall biosynthesis